MRSLRGEARISNLSYSSQTCYANTFKQLRECFGDAKKLAHIRQLDAESFMSSRHRRDGRPGKLSSWSLAQHLKHCRALFGAAVEWGCVERNPFRPASSRGQSSLHIRGKSRPWHHITPHEFRRLLSATPCVRRRALFWLMYGCGLRPGEAINLTVDRIDLRTQMITVENRAATDSIPPFTVKSDDQSDESKARTVPIPTPAMADLAAAMRLAVKSGGFLALTAARFQKVQENWRKCRAGEPRGASKKVRPWEPRDMLNNLGRSADADIRRAGIDVTAPISLTTVRKGFAQNHANTGTPPKTLASLLGHSDVKVTLQYYNRVTDANRATAAAAMNALLSPNVHCMSTGAVSDDVA